MIRQIKRLYFLYGLILHKINAGEVWIAHSVVRTLEVVVVVVAVIDAIVSKVFPWRWFKRLSLMRLVIKTSSMAYFKLAGSRGSNPNKKYTQVVVIMQPDFC